MKCLYCGGGKRIQTEHLVPRKRGGLNIEGNIFRACGACNASKSDQLPSEWRNDLPPGVYELERVALSLHSEITPRKNRGAKHKLVLKNESINVRCTTKQKESIEMASKSEGVGTSTWLLRLGLLAVETKGRLA